VAPVTTEAPAWRQGFDAVERRVAPQLEGLLHSDPVAIALGLGARLQRVAQDHARQSTRRFLHALNLPAGTDVTRILRELGELKRQVRELTAEVERGGAARRRPRQVAR
jgi:hypothetical protein